MTDGRRDILIIMGRYLPGYKDGGPVRSIKNLTDFLGKEYNFKINATGNIIYDAAYQYVDNSNQCNGVACQPSVLVGPTTKNIAGALDFKIVPDTASSLSKTIYYIGFIILLSGAGIIYANIRPKKQESE